MSYMPNMSLKELLFVISSYLRQIAKPIFVNLNGRVSADVSSVASVTTVANVSSVGGQNAVNFSYHLDRSSWANSVRARIQ